MSTPKGPAVVTVDLDTHELATVLAALRHWQQFIAKHEMSARTGHFKDDNAVPLTVEEIDTLCEQINCSGVVERVCTCDDRSWYGEEHDTACELEGKR